MNKVNEFSNVLIRLLTKSKLLFLSVIFLTIFGSLFMYYTWTISIEETSNKALQLAMAAEAGFQKSALGKLESTPSDLEKPEYKQIKSSLVKLASLNEDIRFAYIYTQKDGKVYLMAHSEPPDSKDYSPPGQEYTEATEADKKAFKDGKIVITAPYTDRWGTWVSVLVPMKDLETGDTIAVFAIDYPAEKWNDRAIIRTVQAGIVVLFLFLILLAFYKSFKRNLALKEEKNKLADVSKKLKESEELFRTVFEQSPIGIAICCNDNHILDINSMYEKITGRSKEDIDTLGWERFTHPDDLQKDLDNYAKFKSGENNGYSIVKRFIKPDSSVIWVNLTIAPLDVGDNSDKNHICLIEDITARLQSEEKLRESERIKAVLLSNLPGMSYRCNYDRERTMQFVSEGCFDLTGYKPDSLLGNKEICFKALISPKYQDYLWNKWAQILAAKTKLKEEYEIITATSEVKWVLDQGQGIYDENGEIEALEGLIIDITDRKMREEEIRYLNYHDYLTGLYNRRFFEEEKIRLDVESQLPLSVLIGDINGVKLINDAFGHAEGDVVITETAKIMYNCCREEDVLARIGGDEFIILMPQTDSDTAYDILNKIRSACETYNRSTPNDAYSINISLGYGTKETVDEDFQLVLKKAEDYMYKRKLLEHKSSHSAILSSIKATMFERSQETEEHAERLTVLSKMVGMELNLSQTKLDELELLAVLHDIGKVGIDDRILNKPGKLTEKEWVEMKKHPEIGYRIAMASPELVSIAEYILCHHERWDGKGYPQGLKENGIPLLSRILAVVDAYDAMIHDRTYRKAMTEEAAIAEIVRSSGTQFDPNIAKIFIEKVLLPSLCQMES